MRTAAREQIRCGVKVDGTLGEHQGCDRIEAGFLEGVETPVEHALMLALAGPRNELVFHTLVFGSNEAALNGRRRQQGFTRARDAPTSPE